MPAFDLTDRRRLANAGQEVPYPQRLAHRGEGALPALRGVELYAMIGEDLARPSEAAEGLPDHRQDRFDRDTLQHPAGQDHPRVIVDDREEVETSSLQLLEVHLPQRVGMLP